MTEDTAAPPPRPERLTRLQCAGFRSLRAIDVTLGDLNILVGANGSGKSNFVGLFNLLSFLLSERLQTYVQRRGGASSILHYGPKLTPELSLELTFEGPQLTSHYDLELEFAAPDRLVFSLESLAYKHQEGSRIGRWVLGSAHTESRLQEFARQPEQDERRKIAQPFVRRLQGVQVYHFHDTSETAPIRLTQDLDRNGHLLSTGANLAAFLYMLRERHPLHYDNILATVRLAVPYLRDLLLDPDPLNPGKIKLRWRDHDLDYEFGPHQLSDGSLRAIALITALLQPEELLPWVIVIDEPELGLHPSAIATIAQLIRATSRKRQIVVATQSSRLLACFEPEDVIVVEREEDEFGRGASTLQRLERAALGAWMESYDLGQLFDMNVTGGGPR